LFRVITGILLRREFTYVGEEDEVYVQQHAQRITQLLQQARQECRANIQRVDDPKAQGLFETYEPPPKPYTE
jgi:hypothetical protein